MDSIEKLDAVLKFLSDIYEKQTYTNIKTKLAFEVTDKELELILTKLQKDGYIEFSYLIVNGAPSPLKTGGIYYINFDGQYFFDNGGYGQSIINLSSETQRIVSLEIRTYRATFWMSIGAVGLLVLELIKIYLTYFSMDFD